MEYLSEKRRDSTDKLLKINNLSGRRQDSTDKLFKTNNLSGRRLGFTDKRGLRFTDRRSLDFPDTCHLDFPDTCHLDFPDTRYLNFPDASQLTKRPKSGTTELTSQMVRGGLTALGTRGRGPLSGRAWSAQSHSETGRGEPTSATPGRLFC